MNKNAIASYCERCTLMDCGVLGDIYYPHIKLLTIAVELQWWTTDVESVVAYTIRLQAQFGLEPTMIA